MGSTRKAAAPAGRPGPAAAGQGRMAPARQRASTPPERELSVSSPRDPAEMEAAAAARRVMRMPVPEAGPWAPPPPDGVVPATPRATTPAAAMPEMAPGAAAGLPPGLGSGVPLPTGVRAFMEPRFGASFAGVRIHTGAVAERWNQRLQAKAFTVGPHIVFGPDRFQPDTADGRELLAHELAHVVQGSQPGTATAAVIQRDEAPAGLTTTPDPDKPVVATPPAADDEADAELKRRREFPFAAAKADPALLVVPPDASAADIADRLLGNEQRVDAFDGERPGGQPAVRARDAAQLRVQAQEALRAALEPALTVDTDAVVAILKQRLIGEADEQSLLRHVVAWSRRATIRDAAGVHYFDRFLQALQGRTLVQQGLFSDTKKNALEWLQIEAEDKAPHVNELIAARSTLGLSAATTLKAPGSLPAQDGVSGLPRYSVVGHYIVQYPKQRMALATPDPQVRDLMVDATITVETSRERAETATRNAPQRGPRVVIPGSDGKFYGFTVSAMEPFFEETYQPPSEEKPGPTLVDHWFIFPGTVFIRGGEFRAEFSTAGGDAQRQQREALLTQALDKTSPQDPAPALGLDFDVLSVASVDQRIALLKKVLETPKVAESRVPDLIARLVWATPKEQFAAFERRLATEGVLDRLLSLNAGTNMLGTIGRVFTVKALQSMPLGGAAAGELQSFKLGKDADGYFWYAMSQPVAVRSATADANDNQAAAVGREPLPAGQSPGAFTRSAIEFYPGRFGLKFRQPEPLPKTRPFLPTELVRIEVLGPQPRVLIVSALEAAGLLDITPGVLMENVVKPIAQVWSVALATTGVLRVFGTAVGEGLLAGGLRGGLAAAGEVAATRAGTAALFDAAVLGSFVVVERYRDELQQSAAGREFLGLYDAATLLIAARDIHQLIGSGLLPKLRAAGIAAWGVAGAAARAGIARAIDEAEALGLAWQRTKWVKVAEEAGTGMKMLEPAEGPGFAANLRVARGEVAGRRLVSTLAESGASTTTANAVMARLQKLAGDSPEVARAQYQVATKAAAMKPEAAEKFLQSVEETLGMRSRSTAQVADFLTAAARASDPIAYLAEVRTLLARSKLSQEAIGVLAAKARSGSLDVAWLNRTSISDKLLDSLGRDQRTPWQAYKAAALDPGNERMLRWAQASLRGAGAELATEEAIAKIVPGHKLTGWQAEMEGSIIDYTIKTSDGLGKIHGLEVKGWSVGTWRDALNAYEARAALGGAAKLTKEQGETVKKIDHMLGQLRAAQSATKNPPYLVVTDALTAPVRNKLNNMLAEELPETIVKTVSESRIKDIAAGLGSSLGIAS